VSEPKKKKKKKKNHLGSSDDVLLVRRKTTTTNRYVKNTENRITDLLVSCKTPRAKTQHPRKVDKSVASLPATSGEQQSSS
jgi:hypothetical protein